MTTTATSDPLKHHYSCLTPAERLALTIEAMARGDENEADRLGDACPKHHYRHIDAEFRDPDAALLHHRAAGDG